MSRDWAGRCVVVLGAGRSGVAAANLLAHLGARVTLTDSRSSDRLPYLGGLEPSAARLAIGGHPDSIWEQADGVVVSPGIDPQAAPLREARERNLAVVSELELAADAWPVATVAITGSNGKSTVTSMVGAILTQAGYSTAVCGNIGLPLSTVALRGLRGEPAIERRVVELSSFQTESIVEFRARWNAILNLSADHLDRHGDFATYARAKLRLTVNCGPGDWLVFGASDPVLAKAITGSSGRRVGFGLGDSGVAPSAWIEDGVIYWRDPDGRSGPVIGAGDLRVVGGHNLLNAAAATALGCLAGAPPEAAAEALRKFVGLEHRMEPCGEVNGVICINDSKATNVGATAAALSGLDRDIWLILGGRDKGSDFASLRPLMKGRVRRVLLIGEATGKIASSLAGAVPLIECGDLEAALSAGLEAAAPGDAVLLAPACTSFDQYDDFEARGRHFRALVEQRTGSPATG